MSGTALTRQDTNLRYQWVRNPHVEFAHKKLPGVTDWDVFPPQDAARIVAAKQRVLASGVGEKVAIESKAGDGDAEWFDLSVDPIVDVDGRIIGLSSASTRITGRKRAEIEANHDRDRFQAIFDAVNDGIFITDPATARFTETNDAGARMFGYDKVDLIGRDFGQLSSGVHPYTLEAAMKRTRSARREKLNSLNGSARPRMERCFGPKSRPEPQSLAIPASGWGSCAIFPSARRPRPKPSAMRATWRAPTICWSWPRTSRMLVIFISTSRRGNITGLGSSSACTVFPGMPHSPASRRLYVSCILTISVRCGRWSKAQ